jgi:hypothetical protein
MYTSPFLTFHAAQRASENKQLPENELFAVLPEHQHITSSNPDNFKRQSVRFRESVAPNKHMNAGNSVPTEKRHECSLQKALPTHFQGKDKDMLSDELRNEIHGALVSMDEQKLKSAANTMYKQARENGDIASARRLFEQARKYAIPWADLEALEDRKWLKAEIKKAFTIDERKLTNAGSSTIQETHSNPVGFPGNNKPASHTSSQAKTSAEKIQATWQQRLSNTTQNLLTAELRQRIKDSIRSPQDTDLRNQVREEIGELSNAYAQKELSQKHGQEINPYTINFINKAGEFSKQSSTYAAIYTGGLHSINENNSHDPNMHLFVKNKLEFGTYAQLLELTDESNKPRLLAKLDKLREDWDRGHGVEKTSSGSRKNSPPRQSDQRRVSHHHSQSRLPGSPSRRSSLGTSQQQAVFNQQDWLVSGTGGFPDTDWSATQELGDNFNLYPVDKSYQQFPPVNHNLSVAGYDFFGNPVEPLSSSTMGMGNSGYAPYHQSSLPTQPWSYSNLTGQVLPSPSYCLPSLIPQTGHDLLPPSSGRLPKSSSQASSAQQTGNLFSPSSKHPASRVTAANASEDEDSIQIISSRRLSKSPSRASSKVPANTSQAQEPGKADKTSGRGRKIQNTPSKQKSTASRRRPGSADNYKPHGKKTADTATSARSPRKVQPTVLPSIEIPENPNSNSRPNSPPKAPLRKKPSLRLTLKYKKPSLPGVSATSAQNEHDSTIEISSRRPTIQRPAHTSSTRGGRPGKEKTPNKAARTSSQDRGGEARASQSTFSPSREKPSTSAFQQPPTSRAATSSSITGISRFSDLDLTSPANAPQGQKRERSLSASTVSTTIGDRQIGTIQQHLTPGILTEDGATLELLATIQSTLAKKRKVRTIDLKRIEAIRDRIDPNKDFINYEFYNKLVRKAKKNLSKS